MSSFKKEKEIQQSITDSINKILSEAVVNGFAPPAKQGAAISVPSKNAGAFTSQSSLPDTEENDPAEEVYKSILLPKKPSPVIRTVNGIMKDITTKKPSPVIDTVNGIMKDITAPVAAKKPSPVIDTVNSIMKDITAPMGTPNTSGTAIRSPFVAKPQINTPATNPGFMVSPQGAPSSRPSQTGDFKVTPANPSTPATNPGFMVSPQGAPASNNNQTEKQRSDDLKSVSKNPNSLFSDSSLSLKDQYAANRKSNNPNVVARQKVVDTANAEAEADKQTGTNGRNIGDMRKENEQYAQAAKDRGEPVLVGSPEWVAWNRAKNQKRLDDAGINKTVDQVVSPQPETASDVVGGAAAAGAAYRNDPTGVAGRNAPTKMPPRGGGSNVGLSTPSDSSGTPLFQPGPAPYKPTDDQISTTNTDIDSIAKVAWWRRTSEQRDIMKKNEDDKATAQRTADVDRVQAQRNATAARERDELESLNRYRERQNVQEQTRDPNDPLYGLNIKQGPKRDLDADLKTLAVKAGQFGIDTAKGALKLGTLIAIPPEELITTATGRMAGLGYSKQGAKDRFDYYRSKIDQAPGALTGIIGDAASLLKNVAPGLSNTLGKSAGKVVGAITGSKLAKMGSAVAGSNTGKALFGAAKTYGRATADEAARLMTGALYDPRSVSLPLGSEYTEPKETEPKETETKEEEEKKTKTP